MAFSWSGVGCQIKCGQVRIGQVKCGDKCWHLAVQQQLPLHLELLLQQLLLCCLLVPELKHLEVGIVLPFANANVNAFVNANES